MKFFSKILILASLCLGSGPPAAAQSAAPQIESPLSSVLECPAQTWRATLDVKTQEKSAHPYAALELVTSDASFAVTSLTSQGAPNSDSALTLFFKFVGSDADGSARNATLSSLYSMPGVSLSCFSPRAAHSAAGGVTGGN